MQVSFFEVLKGHILCVHILNTNYECTKRLYEVLKANFVAIS